MLMIERFGALLQEKKVSAEDVARRAGLGGAYIRRVERGQTTPSLDVWERIAMALEVPLARLFYDGEGAPYLPNLPGRKTADDIAGVGDC